MRREAAVLRYDRPDVTELKSSWLKVRGELAYVKLLFALGDTPSSCRPPSAACEGKYSPDQPRVPAGNGRESGQWTSGGGGGIGDSATINELIRNPELDALLQNVAYPGDFHDVVRDYLVKGLREGGATIVTEVTLVLPGNPPVQARIDILGRSPTGNLFGIDVKTGENPTFTAGQAIVYPHAVGGAGVVSYDSKIEFLGLTPGTRLPAFLIDAVYTAGYGKPMNVVPVPAEPK